MSLSIKLKYLNIDNFKLFNGLRIGTSICLFIFLLLLPFGFILAPIGAILYYVIYRLIIVDFRIEYLNRLYELESVTYFENFLLVLKSGCNMKTALIKTCNVVDNHLSKLILFKIKNSGSTTFYDLIGDIAEAIPSSTVCNILYEIREAYRNGNNLGDSIRIQINYIRDTYNTNIINYYRLIPIKVFLLSLTCTIILIFLLYICC